MKIIDGENAVMGRLASYVAKQALQGEEVAVINCDKVIITGNKRFHKDKFDAGRRKVGTIQRGPKISKSSDKIVKRSIRGMLPNYREGRGRQAWKRIKCYVGIPKELKIEEGKVIKAGKEKTTKFMRVEELGKWAK